MRAARRLEPSAEADRPRSPGRPGLAARAGLLVGGADPLSLPLRMLLLAFLLNAALHWVSAGDRLPLLLLAAAGLLSDRLLRHPALWAGLALVLGLRLLRGWPFPDNHDYLACYAALAVAGALLSPAPSRDLARGATWLLGLAFAFAVLWKGFLSPDFVDGRFFRVTLLFDSRFQDVARLLGGMNEALFEHNEAVLAGTATGFAEPERLRLLARSLTLSTLGLETGIALAFLWPGDRRVARVGDALLLLFCVGTYAIAPVAGFGWLLAALGCARSGPARPGIRLAWVLVFGLVLIYRLVPVTGFAS